MSKKYNTVDLGFRNFLELGSNIVESVAVFSLPKVTFSWDSPLPAILNPLLLHRGIFSTFSAAYSGSGASTLPPNRIPFPVRYFQLSRESYNYSARTTSR